MDDSEKAALRREFTEELDRLEAELSR
jgi:hypothetical protein